MKIKKLKIKDKYIYPATITLAIKDSSFLSETEKPMNLNEINLYLNSEVKHCQEDTVQTSQDLLELLLVCAKAFNELLTIINNTSKNHLYTDE